jgi:hypothetical protein
VIASYRSNSCHQLIYTTILKLAPSSALAVEARAQLNLAIECFQTGARFGSGRAKHSLVSTPDTTHEDLGDLPSGDYLSQLV